VILPKELPLMDFIEFLREKLLIALVAAGVWGWSKPVYRKCDGWDKEFSHEWLRVWARLDKLVRKAIWRTEILQ